MVQEILLVKITKSSNDLANGIKFIKTLSLSLNTSMQITRKFKHWLEDITKIRLTLKMSSRSPKAKHIYIVTCHYDISMQV